VHRRRRSDRSRGGVGRLTYVIRATRAADARWLPAIEQSAGQVFLAVPGLEWIAGDHNMAASTHAVLAMAGTSWVAVNGADAPVGFIACEERGDVLHICEFAVGEALHGQGVGRALLDGAVAFARSRDLVAVTLTTFRDVAWNQGFYTRRGFATVAPVGDEPLAVILRDEAQHGLPPERRCAMRLALN
jgi:ribosomal protein S18 acetylase RimI-like enzyme